MTATENGGENVSQPVAENRAINSVSARRRKYRQPAGKALAKSINAKPINTEAIANTTIGQPAINLRK